MNTLGTLKVLFPADRYDHMNFAFDSEPRYHFNRRAVLSCFSYCTASPPRCLVMSFRVGP
jgi:hypothetical protein